jgi:hypothetical protein
MDSITHLSTELSNESKIQPPPFYIESSAKFKLKHTPVVSVNTPSLDLYDGAARYEFLVRQFYFFADKSNF